MDLRIELDTYMYIYALGFQPPLKQWVLTSPRVCVCVYIYIYMIYVLYIYRYVRYIDLHLYAYVYTLENERFEPKNMELYGR